MAAVEVFIDTTGFLALWDVIRHVSHIAANWFRKHGDKQWSFADYVSFAVMHKLRIREAFTTDHHFRRTGFTPLLKA